MHLTQRFKNISLLQWLLAASVLLATCCAVIIALDEITTGNWDDIFYLHSSPALLVAPSYLTQVYQDVMCFFGQNADYAFSAFRFEVRHVYYANYLLHTALIALVDWTLVWAGLPLGLAMQYGHIVVLGGISLGMLGLLARQVIVYHGVNRALLPLMLLLLSSVFFWLLYDLKIYPWVPITWSLVTPGEVWKLTIAYLVYPMSHYDILGASPRCAAMIAIIIAFAARWAGKHGAAFFWLLIASLFHQSYALLATTMMIGASVLYQPDTLRQFAVRAWLLALVILALLRIQLMAPLSQAPAEVGLVVVSSVLCLLAATGIFSWLARSVLPLRLWQKLPPLASDFMVLLGGYIIILVAAFLVQANTDANTARYYAAEPPGRYLSIVRPLFILIIGFAIMDWLKQRLPAGSLQKFIQRAALGIVGAMVIIVGVAWWHNSAQIAKFPSALADELAASAIAAPVVPPREHDIYYVINCGFLGLCPQFSYRDILQPYPDHCQ